MQLLRLMTGMYHVPAVIRGKGFLVVRGELDDVFPPRLLLKHLVLCHMLSKDALVSIAHQS